mgnify:CR=1 FL=1
MTVTFTDLKAKDKEALTACKSTMEYAKKATTLAGYGITDAYTKSEADAAITIAISAITDGDSAGY